MAVRARGACGRTSRRVLHRYGAQCRAGVPGAAQKRGDIEEIAQGTFLATHSLRRSGMRNAGENDRWRKDR
jgi:hypothetical protein